MYRYITLFEQTGDVKPKSYRHGPPKLLGDIEQLFLLQVILTYPGNSWLIDSDQHAFIKYLPAAEPTNENDHTNLITGIFFGIFSYPHMSKH